MKVVIGNYVSWIGPYQIAEMLMFWSKDEDKKHRFGEWLATDVNGKPSVLAKFCEWLHSKKKRRIKVKLDDWDDWNADYTIAVIALPLLQSLKTSKQGAPYVDDSDVPLELHSTLYPQKEEYGTDGNHFKRWDYVIDEMIYSLNHTVKGNDDQFYDHSEAVESDDLNEVLRSIKYDVNGHRLHEERVRNGYRLFGKYFQCLWS